MTEKIVRVGVGVMVELSEGVVLLKRIGSHGEGEWSFPGGKIEFGESILDCAIRETLEETGLVLQNARKLPITTEDHFPGQHWITVYVHGTAEGKPSIMEPNKATKLAVLPLSWPLPSPLFCGVERVWNGRLKGEF